MTGTVNVIGAGSTWTNSSFVTISGEGSDANIVGAVNISGGATVKSTTGTVAEYGSAAAEISGTGSSWTNSSDFAVGHLGRGRLKISGGGELANVSGFVAGEPQSTGAVRVDGLGSIWRNSGSLFVGHAGTGSLAISNGGSVRNVGGFVGHLTGARGRVMVEGAGSAWMNSGNVFIGGDIGSAAQRGRGSLRMRNGGTTSAYSVTVRRPGTLSGSGTINANTLTNNGIVAPGDRLGALRVNGDYTQNADGVLNIQIGGNTVGASYDQLQISGTATLVGTLNISVVDGYRPAVGDVFTVITAESVSGSFAHINAAGLTVQANYASGAVTLTVAALPDVLLNISTRLHVGTGDNALIGGFIITGGEPKRVIIRAIGPSLSKHGISGPLADPTLQLFDSMGEPIFFNDNWKESQQTEIENTGLAPSVEREAALVATLDPGNYTAIVRGKDHTTGVGLVEVYDLAKRARAKLANVSARGRISTGENVMIGGFITGGGTSNTRVLARALGPSLPAHGISDTLHNPVLELRDANGALVRQNDNWRESQQREIAATGIAPRDELEAALIATLSAANYTAVVRGKDQGTGVALIELYALE